MKFVRYLDQGRWNRYLNWAVEMARNMIDVHDWNSLRLSLMDASATMRLNGVASYVQDRYWWKMPAEMSGWNAKTIVRLIIVAYANTHIRENGDDGLMHSFTLMRSSDIAVPPVGDSPAVAWSVLEEFLARIHPTKDRGLSEAAIGAILHLQHALAKAMLYVDPLGEEGKVKNR